MLNSLTVSLLAVLFAVSVLPRSYGAPADVGIVTLLREGARAPFISSQLSDVLVTAYKTMSADVAWYAIYLYASLVLVLAASLRLLLGFEKKPGPLTGGFLVACLGFVSQLTYTSVSILLGYLGVLSFLECARQWNVGARPRTEGLQRTVFSGVLLALSYTTRPDGTKAALVFSAPLVVWVVLMRARDKGMLPGLLLFSVPLLLTFGIDSSLQQALREDKPFLEYTAVRGETLGFPSFYKAATSRELLELNQWSLTDYGMFASWLHIDEATFSLQKVKNLVATMRSINLQMMRSLADPRVWPRALLLTGVHWLRSSKTSFLLLLMLMIIGSCEPTNDAKTFLVLYVIWLVACSVAMVSFLRFPDRIALPIFYGSALSLVIVPCHAMSSSSLSHAFAGLVRRRTGLCVVFLLFVAISLLGAGLVSQKASIARYKRDLAYLNDLGHDSYILKSAVLPYELTDPLEPKPLPKSELGPGWLIFSPVFYHRLREVGLSNGRELLPWMLDNPRALLVVNISEVAMIHRFVKQTYDLSSGSLELGRLPSQPTVGVFRLVWMPNSVRHNRESRP